MALAIKAAILPQHPGKEQQKNKIGLQSVRNLVQATGVPSLVSAPQESLHKGNWVKLICGASFEDVVDIRNLSLVYTLAGVDCIDCAADESVINAVSEGIEAARNILHFRRPWVMISVNDDQDLHFRKAGEVTYVRDATATAKLLKRHDVDAIEIHTSGRQTGPFKELWDGLGNSIGYLKLVAVSLPYSGDSTLSSMRAMYSIMESDLQHSLNLWQLDGRPMSGDIGRGATRESIAFAVRLAAVQDKPHGFFQLAGGTNAHTVEGLKKEGLFQASNAIDSSKSGNSCASLRALIGGIAYGGYARKIVGRVLSSMQSEVGLSRLENHPELLLKAVREAIGLVGTVKSYDLS
ncbi:hypothetical protein Tsubulata_036846 [Turnera subulata]|uniref:Iron-sulphur binding protein LdpA C-terminal domain-containing protein n=1 Tax=Turnera subulata TaxID=218843 RepID=A0A9Q0FXL5_9ROSI|nr:hypothetical protein Tsubulata_036846 [Turnera subulata]